MNFRVTTLFLLFFIIFSQALFGQRPQSIKFKGNLNKSLRNKLGCAGAEAGTFKLTGGGSASTKTIKYLCKGDTLKLVHDKNSRFGGDPIAATQPGIGYIYFDCKPTIERNTLAQLLTERCLNKTSPINNNGTPLNQTKGFWVTRGSVEGDINFINDSYQQNAFNNGKPVQFWFAPVTLDAFVTPGTQPDFENTNGVAGACIDLNIDSAFSVVYLNELTLTNVVGTNNGVGNYSGTFTVSGGLPQFDTTKNYNGISIINDKDNAAIGRLTNAPAKHGKPMQFTVPKPGVYDITITDENGCSTTTKVEIKQDPIDVKVACVNGTVGEEICIPIRVGKVPGLTAAQFTLGFNPQQLVYVSSKNLNPKLKSKVEDVVITNTIAQGFLKFFWLDFNLDPHDFTAEDTLVEFCFKVIGPPGITKINIIPEPGPAFPKLEFSNPDGNPLPLSSTSVLSCNVAISPAAVVDAFYFQCGVVLFGQPSSGRAPYKFYYYPVGNISAVDSSISLNSNRDTIFFNKTGKYVLRMVDSTGAFVTDTLDVTSIADLSVDLSNRINESCKGNDGRIVAIASGGTGGNAAYRYEWGDGSVGDRIQRLKAGVYKVTVTDANGCTVTDSIRVDSERPKSAILIDRKPECDGISDGKLSPDFSLITGIRPYSFQWIGNGSTIGNAFTNLTKGTYGLIVTDANKCSDTTFAAVDVRKYITADILADSVQCFNNSDGRITISNRKFSDGNALTLDSVIVTNLNSQQRGGYIASVARHDKIVSGFYQIQIKDQSGCRFLDTIEVGQPSLLDTVGIITIPESCRPGADGRITINMKGGTGPYTFSWADNPSNTNTRTGLVANTYDVIIRDKNGCLAKFADTVTNQNRLSFEFTKVVVPVSIDTTAIKCFGQTATLTARPGAGFNIASYKWSNGDTTIMATNVSAGITTTLEVTDKDGCKGMGTITLSQPQRLRVVDSFIQANVCPGLSQGFIRIDSLAGGTRPYTYTLQNGPSQNFGFFRNLLSGMYTINITDANQCPSYVMKVELKEPPKINAIFDTIAFKSVNCAGTGDCSGEARILLSGGTDPQNRFTVRWQSGEQTANQLTAFANKLCAGNQEVTIIDGNNCSIKVPFSIKSPDAIVRDDIRTQITDITCFGQANGIAKYFPTGGTSPYKFLWSDGDTNAIRNGLKAGKYSIQITDLNNCVFNDSVLIAEPTELIVSLDSIKTRTITCPDINDGQIGIKVTGGNTGSYTHKWSPNKQDTNFIRNIGPGSYTVIVTDVKGCKDTLANILMNEPPKIQVNLPPVFTTICAGDTIGIFLNSVSGGNGSSYSFSINNGNSIPSSGRTPLKAGKYQLAVFDRKGCSLDTTITVVDPPLFVIDLGNDKKIRLGDSLRIITNSNNPLNKVTWPNEAITCLSSDCSIVSVSPFQNTTLTAQAVDRNGCKATDNLIITVDTRRSVFIPNIFRPNQLSNDQQFRMYTGSGVAQINFVRIFNRFGAVVHEARNLAPDPAGVLLWDGRIRGKDAPIGVYIYIAEVLFTDGVKLIYKGDVTLIR